MKNLFVLFLVFFTALSFGMRRGQTSAGAVGGMGEAINFETKPGDFEEGGYLSRLRGVQLYLHIDTSGSLGQCQDKETYVTEKGQRKRVDTAPSDSIIEACTYKQTTPGRPWLLWDSAKVLALCFVNVMLKIDGDGKVPVYCFANDVDEFIIKNSDDLIKKLSQKNPSGMTEMRQSLICGFDEQDKDKPTELNKALHVVLTDGAPSDESTKVEDKKQSLENAQRGVEDIIQRRIVDAGLHKRNKANVLFVRVGNDEKAKNFLKYIDDCEEIGSCVDTQSARAVFDKVDKEGVKGIAKFLINGIYEDVNEIEFAEN